MREGNFESEMSGENVERNEESKEDYYNGLVSKLKGEILTNLRTSLLLDSEKKEKRRALLAAFENLAKEVKKHADEYESIIGDDASGRLPAIFAEHIINRKRKEDGLNKIPLRFVGVIKDGKEVMQKIKEYIEKSLPPGKTLIVTEYMHGGETIRALVRVLDELGKDFDIATVSKHKFTNLYPGANYAGFGGKDVVEENKGRRIIEGEKGGGNVGEFMYNHLGSGVSKYNNGWRDKIFAHSTPKEIDDLDKSQFELRKKYAREDMKMLADEFYKD